MQILGLTKENVDNFTKYLTPDIAEHIGRSFICGLVLIPEDESADEKEPDSSAEPVDGSSIPAAAIVWELKQGEDDLDIASNILLFKAENEEAADDLLSEYTELVSQMECSFSSFELSSSLGSIEKNALEKAGFETENKEGKVISVALVDMGNALMDDDRLDDNIRPLKEAEDREFENAIARLDYEGKRGSLEDMPYLPKDYFDNEISCYSSDEDLISAMVLMHRCPSGKIEVALAEVIEDETEDIKKLLKQSVILSYDFFDPGTKFLFDRSDASLNLLAKELFPTTKGLKVFAGFRKEEPSTDVEPLLGEVPEGAYD